MASLGGQAFQAGGDVNIGHAAFLQGIERLFQPERTAAGQVHPGAAVRPFGERQQLSNFALAQGLQGQALQAALPFPGLQQGPTHAVFDLGAAVGQPEQQAFCGQKFDQAVQGRP